jgi:hypothetical protein
LNKEVRGISVILRLSALQKNCFDRGGAVFVGFVGKALFCGGVFTKPCCGALLIGKRYVPITRPDLTHG